MREDAAVFRWEKRAAAEEPEVSVSQFEILFNHWIFFSSTSTTKIEHEQQTYHAAKEACTHRTDHRFPLPVHGLDLSGRADRYVPDLYDLYDLYDLAHVGWEPYNLHGLGHVSWGGYVLYRSHAAYHNGRLGYR